MSLESRLIEALVKLGLHQNCAVAVSGGVDSMTLLHLVALIQKKNHFCCPTVLTVNHGFRPEGEQETRFVYEHATALGLPCAILNLQQGEKPSNKSQQAARELRYTLMSEWCIKHSVRFLVTAHNKNDQAETVLMRLERGSGIDGLSGMRQRSFLAGIEILRPFLNFTRREILHYATGAALLWVEDPSNKNPRYHRTLYRNMIQDHKDHDTLIDRLCRTAKHMSQAVDCVLHYVKSSLDVCMEFHSLGFVIVKSHAFCVLPKEVASRLLLYTLMVLGHKIYKPRYERFRRIFNLIRNNEPFAPSTLHCCKIMRNANGDIEIVKELAFIECQQISAINATTIEWDRRFILKISNVEKALVAPLAQNAIPEHLKSMNREAVHCLPVLVRDDKVLAYPSQKRSMELVPTISIEEVLVRRGVVDLIDNLLNR